MNYEVTEHVHLRFARRDKSALTPASAIASAFAEAMADKAAGRPALSLGEGENGRESQRYPVIPVVRGFMVPGQGGWSSDSLWPPTSRWFRGSQREFPFRELQAPGGKKCPHSRESLSPNPKAGPTVGIQINPGEPADANLNGRITTGPLDISGFL